MKKLIGGFLIFILLAFSATLFSSCGGGKSGVRTAIPESGIVSAREFEQIRGQNTIRIFYDVKEAYEWTFFGSDISETKDADLRLSLCDDLGSAFDRIFGTYVSFTLQSRERYPGNPTLTVRLKEWKDGNVYLYHTDGNQTAYLKAASVVDEKCSFTLENMTGGIILISAVRTEDVTDPEEDGYRPPDVLPEDDSVSPSVTLTITCHNAVANWKNLKPQAQSEKIVPKSGIILQVTRVEIQKGDTVYDVLTSVAKNRFQTETEFLPLYNAAYVKSINNLYAFDCGSLSGWMYCVNSWYPGYSCSRYKLKNGDAIEFNYTCDLGRDLGKGMA